MDNLFSRQSSRVDEENPYWISFSDLMSGLLVIFILAAVALIIELTQKTEQINEGINELKRAELARKNIIYEMQEELSEQGIKVEIVDNDTVVRIPEGTLGFASGESELPDNKTMQAAARKIGEALHNAIMRKERFTYLDTVFIEGHTDSDGMDYGWNGNWELSADRAISIWRLWQNDLEIDPKLGDLYNAYEQRLFSVSGYAATRRVDVTEANDDQKAKNRRIDIRFTVKKPSIAELEAITSEQPIDKPQNSSQ